MLDRQSIIQQAWKARVESSPEDVVLPPIKRRQLKGNKLTFSHQNYLNPLRVSDPLDPHPSVGPDLLHPSPLSTQQPAMTRLRLLDTKSFGAYLDDYFNQAIVIASDDNPPLPAELTQLQGFHECMATHTAVGGEGEFDGLQIVKGTVEEANFEVDTNEKFRC
jgi:hypothetical protein